MSTIFTQVDGDPVRTAQLSGGSRPNGIRFVRFACLAHRRDMVDIYAQFYHNSTLLRLKFEWMLQEALKRKSLPEDFGLNLG